MTNSLKLGLLLAVTILTLVGIFFLLPMPQDPAFHHFADARPLWGIPNFGNVVSNLAFLAVGIYGLRVVDKAMAPAAIRATYLILFIGVVMTGLGSAHYHWHPSNDTLVWDRIPMTIVFMSFLSVTFSELAGRRIGFTFLLPLVAVGIGSVIWWHHTESLGKGDLRLYFWVQYFPMLAIVLLFWLYYEPGIRPVMRIVAWIVVWYMIAKLFEFFDYPTYDAIGISGHTLKHLAAAVSTGYFVLLFSRKYGAVGDEDFAPELSMGPGGGQELGLITLAKLKEYKRFGGDEDGLTRMSSSYKRENNSKEWALISSLIQDIKLVSKGLASEEYGKRLDADLARHCDGEGTMEEIKRLAVLL